MFVQRMNPGAQPSECIAGFRRVQFQRGDGST
jgi:hypothetical protein